MFEDKETSRSSSSTAVGRQARRGRSRRIRKKSQQWTVSGLSQDMVAVADDLKLKKIILIGHSMGGRVCLQAASLMKGRVLGVILVDIMNDVSQRVTTTEAEADAVKLKQDFRGYFRDLSPPRSGQDKSYLLQSPRRILCP
jgi:pimeloyl-ACP methyl ester carboxylesterase